MAAVMSESSLGAKQVAVPDATTVLGGNNAYFVGYLLSDDLWANGRSGGLVPWRCSATAGRHIVFAAAGRRIAQTKPVPRKRGGDQGWNFRLHPELRPLPRPRGCIGGLAPDLRDYDLAPDTDQYFMEKTMKGVVRNGAVKMPPFRDIINQEAIWAIKTYLETRRESK